MHTNKVLPEEKQAITCRKSTSKEVESNKEVFHTNWAGRGVLTVQQGIELEETAEQRPVSREVDLFEEPQSRAKQKYSLCRSIGHTACTCPIRI